MIEYFFEKIDADTIFTVITTISIFFVGIMIQWGIKRQEKDDEKKELREYFNYHFSQLTKNIIPLIEKGYLDFYTTMTIDSGILQTPPILLSGELERISNVDDTNIFKAYTKKEDITKSLDIISGIVKLFAVVEKFHDKILVESDKKRLRIFHLSEKYMKTLVNYLDDQKANNPDYQNSKTYKLIYKCVEIYHTEMLGKRVLRNYYKKIVRKIQLYLVASEEYKTNKFAEEITNVGREFSLAYSELRSLTAEVKCEYRKFYRQIRSTREKMENLLPLLENQD